MRNRVRSPGKIGLSMLYFAAAGALAQPSTAAFTGSITLGTRSVDLSGTRSKYREDINLDDGVRVFDVALSYRPDGAESPVDDVSFVATHLGGDPFESVHLSVRKFGSYSLKLDRRRSDYFYQDTILPLALASVSASTGGDFHHFDFERVRDSAELDIELSPATRMSFGLERQTRFGESTTTLDIERDEFELERPLDEKLEALRFNIEHRWDSVTLIFEEEIRDFENVSETFLPGASLGADPADSAELQFFFLDQAYDYDSRAHVLRAIANPADRIDISAMWRREDLDLDIGTSERSLGTSFGGDPVGTDFSGRGQGVRDLETVAVDIGVRIAERARFIADLRSNELDQRNNLMHGPENGIGEWQIDTDGFEIGAELAVGARTMLTAGWSTETRDVEHLHFVDNEIEYDSTDRDGFFARLWHRTDRGLEVTASIEDNKIDDPFALGTPRDSRRYRVSMRYAFENGIAIQGNHRRTDAENDLSGWMADTEQSDIRLRYQRGGTELSVGASRIDASRSISQLVTGGTIQVLFPIDYAADARQHDVSVRTLIADRFTVGGSVRSYDNRGSYALDRDDMRLFADIPLADAYALTVSYRDIEYREDAFDAYDAELLELGFRLDF